MIRRFLPHNIYTFYKKVFIYFFHKYSKIQYTIFNYPKHYNNFNLSGYIKKNIWNDYYAIIDYFSNIFNLSKWKRHILLLILLLWFYSILLISNNLLYFIFIKFLFYSGKYFFKYLFIFFDFLFYTYLNFTRIPKFFLGLPYLFFIKNLYKLYYLVFYILPLLVYTNYWWDLYTDSRFLLIKKIHSLLDLIEWLIITISKSYFIRSLKKFIYYIKYYILEKDKFRELIDRKQFQLYYFYNFYIIYNFYRYANLKYFLYIKYILKNFLGKEKTSKRIKELYVYIQYIYPYIYFNYYIISVFYFYFINLYYIKAIFMYKKILMLFNYYLYKIYYKYYYFYFLKSIIYKSFYFLFLFIINIINIIFISYLYYNW